MKGLFRNPHKPQRRVTTLYLIGDDNSSKVPLYSHFSITPPEEAQQISISIHQLNDNQFVEIYDFPTDKMLRQALQLYFNILPPPALILYFLKADSTGKQIQQWIGLLKSTHLYHKLAFVSDVDSYLQRENMIVRVGVQFQSVVLSNICFVELDPTAFDKLFANIQNLGITIATAVCLRPTLRQKIRESWQKMHCRVSNLFKRLSRKRDQKSIV